MTQSNTSNWSNSIDQKELRTPIKRYWGKGFRVKGEILHHPYTEIGFVPPIKYYEK